MEKLGPPEDKSKPVEHTLSFLNERSLRQLSMTQRWIGSLHYQFAHLGKKEIKFLIRWIWTKEVGPWGDEENWEVVYAILD